MVKKIGIAVLIVWMAALTTVCIMQLRNQKPKIVFVDSEKVFDEFLMKKDLAKELDKVRVTRQGILDSLANEMQVITVAAGKNPTGAQVEQFQKLRNDYLDKQKQFEEDNQAYVDKLDGQIWSQLEQYLKDFGDEHHYSYVLGKTGRGNVLYSQKGQEVTEEAIEYINNRYNGASKK